MCGLEIAPMFREFASTLCICIQKFRVIQVCVLTGLRAGRFTRPASKPAGAQTGLADTVDSWASKSEWCRNASMKTSYSAGRFDRHNCQQIGRFPICSPTLLADRPILISSPTLLLNQFRGCIGCGWRKPNHLIAICDNCTGSSQVFFYFFFYSYLTSICNRVVMTNL